MKSCGQKGCCEPAAACEPVACKPAACEPAACEPDACDPCGAKGGKNRCCRRPLLDLLDGIFGVCKSKGCGKSCAEPAGCGCGEAEAADAGTTAEAPGELPRAPDPTATLQRTRGIYQASVVRN